MIANADLRKFGGRLFAAAVDALHMQLSRPESKHAEAMANSPIVEKKGWIRRFGLNWDGKIDKESRFACVAVLASGTTVYDGPVHTKEALRTLARLAAGATCYDEVFGTQSNDERKWVMTKILKQKK